MFSNLFFYNRAICEIMWENTRIVEPERPQMTIWCIHISRWVPKATNTQSEYVTPLFYCNSGCTNAPQ